MLSISIMAHISRKEYFDYIRDRLGNVRFAIDLGDKENIWINCKDAWRLNNGKEWHLVLQDDSIICDDFRERAEKILAELPKDYIVSFYAGEKLGPKIAAARASGLDHVIDRRIHNENALCMRTEHLEDMMEFCDSRNARDDRKIQLWANKRKIMVYYPIPSLIDHRTCPSVYRAIHKSELKDSDRQAVWYIDNN